MNAPDRLEIEKAIKRFIVVGFTFFGAGKTLKEARTNAEKQRRRARINPGKLIAFAGTADLSITNSGVVTATWMISLGEV